MQGDEGWNIGGGGAGDGANGCGGTPIEIGKMEKPASGMKTTTKCADSNTHTTHTHTHTHACKKQHAFVSIVMYF